jgi:hypothetical protein
MTHAALTIDLDEVTAGTLRRLSERWGVPPQEAVKRAVQQVAQPAAEAPGDLLKVFRQLQQAVGLTQDAATAWKQAVADARR